MALPLFEALSAWVKENEASGKIEQMWGIAGQQGGGGILNVNSLEELDMIMTMSPLGQFASVEVLPLIALEPMQAAMRAAVQAMPPPGG
jgi:muconolactone delta-isomerase